MKPIFIWSTPRSGSTYLMRLFNATGQVTISGESYGIPAKLIESFSRLCESKRAEGDFNLLEKAGAWLAYWQAVPINDQRLAVKNFIENFYGAKSANRWGYKDLYHGLTQFRLESELKFMAECWPECNVVLLTRGDEESMLESIRKVEWWTPDQSKMARYQRSVMMSNDGHWLYEEMLDYDRIKNRFSEVGIDLSEEVYRDVSSRVLGGT
jgi:hypothetical protein